MVTGGRAPAVVLAAKQNAPFPGNSVAPQATASSLNNGFTSDGATVFESDDMDVDLDGAPGVKCNSASGHGDSPFAGVTFTFQPRDPAQEPTSLADVKLAPRQGDHSYLDGISYDLRRQGLKCLHDEVERMHEQLSPSQGILLDQDGLFELTHGLDAKVLHNIDMEARSHPGLWSDAWLDEKYKGGVQGELIALAHDTTFLAKVREMLDTRDVEMVGTSAGDSCADPTLTQEEFDALGPLNAPASLQGLSMDKRKQFLCRMLRKAKRMNDKVTSAFKERLQSSEAVEMVHQDELKVCHRIDSLIQSLSFKPDDAAIEREYDSQSESELQDCSKFDSFVSKVKVYHRRFKHGISAAKGRFFNAFRLTGSNGASHTVGIQHTSPPAPPAQDVRGSFIAALNDAINAMNLSVSATYNGNVPILKPAEVADLVSKLEAHMLSDLGQKSVSTTLTNQEQEAHYFQAGNEFLQSIKEVECFVDTVKAYRKMTS
jgi:hypothetical protein